MSAREKDLKELLEYYEQNLCHKIFKYELNNKINIFSTQKDYVICQEFSMYMIMISVISLLDDFYVFDEESYKLTGEHTGRIFTLGQKAEIVVHSANKMERTIDFILKEFSQYSDYPDPDDYYGDGMPSRKNEDAEAGKFENFESADGEYPVEQEEFEFDETGESLPDKDGILLNDWIDDEEADRLLHLYNKKKIDEI